MNKELNATSAFELKNALFLALDFKEIILNGNFLILTQFAIAIIRFIYKYTYTNYAKSGLAFISFNLQSNRDAFFCFSLKF